MATIVIGIVDGTEVGFGKTGVRAMEVRSSAVWLKGYPIVWRVLYTLDAFVLDTGSWADLYAGGPVGHMFC